MRDVFYYVISDWDLKLVNMSYPLNVDVGPRDEDSGTDSEPEKVEDTPGDTQQLTQVVDGSGSLDGSNSTPQCWGMLNCKAGLSIIPTAQIAKVSYSLSLYNVHFIGNKQHILYHRVMDGFKDRYVLGRHSSCDIQISDKRISSRHCYIYCDYEESRLRVFLEDCSVNGTYVNDSLSRLHKKERIQLKSGDDIYLINPRYVTGDDGNKAAAFLFVNMRERMMAQRSVGLAPTVSIDRPLVRHIEDDYVIGDEIGKGMSGVVYLCTHRTSGLQCAVKIIDTKKFGLAPGLSPAELREEAQIMKTLNHPNIIKIHDTFETNHVIYIVMELVRGGDLFDSIVVRGRYTEAQARSSMKQIFSAVQYLHSNDIIHRDLKPENILLMEPDSNAGIEENSQVRITDFGLAKKTTQEGLKTFCGTPQYFAPEVLKRRSSVTGAGRYGKAADMWSLGVILFILLSGTFPFDEDALFDQIAGAQYNMNGVEWYHVSQPAKDLIRALMTLMPHERLTIGQAVQHPWLCPESMNGTDGAGVAVVSSASCFNPFSRLMSTGGHQKSMGPPKKMSTISKKQKSMRSQKNVAGGAGKKQRTQSTARFFEAKSSVPGAAEIDPECFDVPKSPPTSTVDVNEELVLTSQRPCIGTMFNSATRCGSVHTIQACLLRSEASIHASNSSRLLCSPVASPLDDNAPVDTSSSEHAVLSSGQDVKRDLVAMRSPLQGLNSPFDIMSPSMLSLEPSVASSSDSISTPTLLLLKKKTKKKEAAKKTNTKSALPEIAEAFLKQKVATSVEVLVGASPQSGVSELITTAASSVTVTDNVLMDVDVNVCGRKPIVACDNKLTRKLTQQKISSNCFAKQASELPFDTSVAVGGFPPNCAVEANEVGFSANTVPQPIAGAPMIPLALNGFKGNPANPNQKKVRMKMRTLQEMFAK